MSLDPLDVANKTRIRRARDAEFTAVLNPEFPYINIPFNLFLFKLDEEAEVEALTATPLTT